MSFFKKNNQRGEIATTLTVAAFVLMMFGVYIGTRTNGPTSQFTRADTAPVPTLPPLSDGRAVPGFDFKPVSGVCTAGIVYRRDPIVYQIEIRDKASGNVFIINDQTPTIPLKGDGNFKRGSQFDSGSGATVTWGPPAHADEIYVLVDNGRKHNTEHYYNRPAWLGLNDVDVVFYYDRIFGPRARPTKITQAYQVAVGKKGCFPETTPTVNPSITPTITPTTNPSVTPTVTPTTNPSVTPTVTPTTRPTATPTPNACPATGTISGHIEITGQLPSVCGANGINCKFQVRICKPNPKDGGKTIECRRAEGGDEYGKPPEYTSTGPGFTYSVSGVPTSEDVGVFVERRLFSAAGADLADLPWNQTALNCTAPRGTRRWLSDCFVRLDKEVPACSATNVNFRIPFPGPTITPSPTPISCPNNKGTITSKVEVVGSLPAVCNDASIFPGGCYFRVWACAKDGNVANCDKAYYDSKITQANGTVVLRNIPIGQQVGVFVDQVMYRSDGKSQETFNNDYIESLRCVSPKTRPLHRRDCFLQLKDAPSCSEDQDFRITFPIVTPTVTPTRPPGACNETCNDLVPNSCAPGLVCFDLGVIGGSGWVCRNPRNVTDPTCRNITPPPPTVTPSPTTPPVCYKDCRSTIDCGRDQLCDFIVQCPPGSAPNCVEKGKCTYPRDLNRSTCDNVTPTVTPSVQPRIKGQIVVKSCVQPDHDVLVDICEQDASGRLASAKCIGPSQTIHLKPSPMDNAVWFRNKSGDVYTYDYLMTEGPSSKPLVSGGYYNLPFSMAQIQNPTNGVIDRLSNERNQQVTLPVGDTVINWTIDMTAETCGPTVTPTITPTPGACRWEATSTIKEQMSNGTIRVMDEIDQDNVLYFNMNNKQRDRHGDGILPPAPEDRGYRFKDGILYASIVKAESDFWPVVVASPDSRGLVYQYSRGEDACVKLYYDKTTYDIVDHEVPTLPIDGRDIKRQPFVNPSNKEEICGLPFACNISYKYGWILKRKPNVPTPTGGSCPLQTDECTPRNFIVDEVKQQTTNVEWQAPRACPQFTPGSGNSVYWILVREGANGPIVSSRGPIRDEDTGIKARDNYLSQVQKAITEWQPGETYYAYLYAYQEGSSPECKSPPVVVTFKRDEEVQPTIPPTSPTPSPVVDDFKTQQLDWVLNGKGICWAGWSDGSCGFSRNGSDAWCESSADKRFKCKAPDGQVNRGYVSQIMLKPDQKPVELNFKSVVCSACHSTPAPDAHPPYDVSYCETGVHGDARENAVGSYTLQPGKCYQLERTDASGNDVQVKEIDCGNAGFNNFCLNNQSGGPHQSKATPSSIPLYFSVANNSSKKINTIEITACQIGGGCTTKSYNLDAASGGNARAISDFSNINNALITTNNRYNVTCALVYADGTRQTCPSKELGPDNPLNYEIVVDGTGKLDTTIETQRMRADCDGDGVPTAKDLAALYANEANNSCDPSPSNGTIDALDRSIGIKWIDESQD